MSSVYQINKGINKPIVFRGLKAQYIWWLGGGLVLLLLLFALLYILGANIIVCVVVIAVFAVGLFGTVYTMSKQFGEHGLMKKMASKSVPKELKGCSRKNVVKGLRLCEQ